jgi:hypothetical protein
MPFSFADYNQKWILLLSLSLAASCIGAACAMLSLRGTREFNWLRYYHECLVRHQIVYPNFYFAILINTGFSKHPVLPLLVCLYILLSFLFLLLGTQRLKELSFEAASAERRDPIGYVEQAALLKQSMRPSITMTVVSLACAVLTALSPYAQP